jgi:IclR family KDG regulon transcriptional repressor
MKASFKRVPALDKSLAILELIALAGIPFSINEVVKKLRLNKSTVFNIMHTLADLNVLERGSDGLFRLGTRLYVLGSAAAKGDGLIQTVHPYLIEINRKTKLSAFLGIRSGLKAVIIDKVDAAFNLKISSEVGMRLSLFAGAGGKALISMLSDEEIDRVLAEKRLKAYTSKTITDKTAFKEAVFRLREEGVTIDREEYIEGVVALAVPLNTFRTDFQAAIWAAGLSQHVVGEKVTEFSEVLKGMAAEINSRLGAAAGPFTVADAAPSLDGGLPFDHRVPAVLNSRIGPEGEAQADEKPEQAPAYGSS